MSFLLPRKFELKMFRIYLKRIKNIYILKRVKFYESKES